MKLLAMTFEPPNYKYGGGLGIIQSLTSLSFFADVDYIGPQYNSENFKNIKIQKNYFLDRSKNIFVCALHLLRAVPTRYYSSWKRVIKEINPKEYDAVYVDFSNHDFITKWAKKNNLKVITRVHNIESDMIVSIKKSKKFDKYKFRAYLSAYLTKKRETKCMNLSDKLLFLTEKDKSRALSLYGQHLNEKSNIVPVCIDSNNRDQYANPLNYKYILITGLLSFGANCEGIMWFLQNVWNKLQQDETFNKDYKLVIAGGNPNSQIKSLCNSIPNTNLIDTPESMIPYFQHAQFYIAPIFNGAGMKVKVAEAFSYGLTVIGTSHALIGYEKAKEFFYQANNEKEFIEAIKKAVFARKDREKCLEMFNSSYSINVSCNLIKNFIEK